MHFYTGGQNLQIRNGFSTLMIVKIKLPIQKNHDHVSVIFPNIQEVFSSSSSTKLQAKFSSQLSLLSITAVFTTPNQFMKDLGTIPSIIMTAKLAPGTFCPTNLPVLHAMISEHSCLPIKAPMAPMAMSK